MPVQFKTPGTILFTDTPKIAMDPSCCCGPPTCTENLCGTGSLKDSYRLTITGSGPWAGVYDLEFCFSEFESTPSPVNCWWVIYPIDSCQEGETGAIQMAFYRSGADLIVDVTLLEVADGPLTPGIPGCLGGSALLGATYRDFLVDCDFEIAEPELVTIHGGAECEYTGIYTMTLVPLAGGDA